MSASEHTKSVFRGRAYGLDIRVEREDDGTLSVYGAEAYTEHYELLARGPDMWLRSKLSKMATCCGMDLNCNTRNPKQQATEFK